MASFFLKFSSKKVPQKPKGSTKNGKIPETKIEDMPPVPAMHANFAANPHAEVIFGRQEPGFP